MEKINKPGNPAKPLDETTSITFFRHDGGWVAKIVSDVEVCGCTGPDTSIESWWQVMDEDELEPMLDYFAKHAVETIADEPEDVSDDEQFNLNDFFDKGVNDGR